MDQRGAARLGQHDPVLDGDGLPLPPGRGHCNVLGCGFAGPIEDVPTSQARMVWHVFTKHPDLYRLVTGRQSGEEPPDPRPSGPVQ